MSHRNPMHGKTVKAVKKLRVLSEVELAAMDPAQFFATLSNNRIKAAITSLNNEAESLFKTLVPGVAMPEGMLAEYMHKTKLVRELNDILASRGCKVIYNDYTFAKPQTLE
jgi:hypothetical protein